MAIFEVPLTAANQTFRVYLGDRHFEITIRWSTVVGAWVIDLADADTAEALINGLVLTTGRNLLQPYEYLGLRDVLLALNDEDLEPPTYENLGTGGHLYFITDAEAFLDDAQTVDS